MKIGIGNGSHAKWGEERYIKLKEHGFECVDFNMMDTDSFPYNLPSKEAEKILLAEKALADAAGVEIYQSHGPWRWPPNEVTVGGMAERLEKMKHSIWAASVLGCKSWVVHPIMPYGVEEKDTENEQKTWDLNLSFMSELLKTAKQYGVTICLENMPMHRFSIATPAQILKFVREINDGNFKICLDTGHVGVFDKLSAGDAVRELAEEIRAFHVHDSNFGIDMHLHPYCGRIDWADFSKALKEINYQGGICLETSPSGNLPEPIYEEMCVILAKMLNYIANA